MGEEGNELLRLSQGNSDLLKELAPKLALFDIEGLWKSLEDKERIVGFLLLAKLAGLGEEIRDR